MCLLPENQPSQQRYDVLYGRAHTLIIQFRLTGLIFWQKAHDKISILQPKVDSTKSIINASLPHNPCYWHIPNPFFEHEVSQRILTFSVALSAMRLASMLKCPLLCPIFSITFIIPKAPSLNAITGRYRYI